MLFFSCFSCFYLIKYVLTMPESAILTSISGKFPLQSSRNFRKVGFRPQKAPVCSCLSSRFQRKRFIFRLIKRGLLDCCVWQFVSKQQELLPFCYYCTLCKTREKSSQNVGISLTSRCESLRNTLRSPFLHVGKANATRSVCRSFT